MTHCARCTFAVIGGGIAGVSCCETLALLGNNDKSIVLLTAAPAIKEPIRIQRVTKMLDSFFVEEKPCESIENRFDCVTVKNALVTHLDFDLHMILCHDGTRIQYEKLCICAGGRPKLITSDDRIRDCVMTIRDSETADRLSRRLKDARRIVIVGNGGLATELAYEIKGCDVIWVVRHDYINNVFFDPAAAKFLLSSLENDNEEEADTNVPERAYTFERIEKTDASDWDDVPAGALGPEWMTSFDLVGKGMKSIKVIYKSEIEDILKKDEEIIDPTDQDTSFRWYVKLTGGQVYGCDVVISAIGVEPNTILYQNAAPRGKLLTSEDGGIVVDKEMMSSIPDVYAAGDVCSVNWGEREDWFQMRTWTQARQMGHYAAKCMFAHRNGDVGRQPLELCFEIFEHCTHFLGQKVVFLGRYNGQGLDKYELLYRMTPDHEFIKLVLNEGLVRGAVIIGDTELAETIENLILGRLNVSNLGENLLDPEIDIAEYFD
ncbi:hypothetical protein ACOME3_005116 [Neoechinorhynchus agilis]